MDSRGYLAIISRVAMAELLYTVITFLYRVKDQKRANIVVLREKICPVNAAKVLPKHQ